jgi:hypothetical protein
MEKKMRSIKLLKDLPACNAGEKLRGSDGYIHILKKYTLTEIKSIDEFFEIIYEEDFFEVADEKTSYIILGDGTIYDFINNNTCHYKQGNAGTKAEMEYRKMYNQTMHYFRMLAEELNGEWRYEVGRTYKELSVNNNKDFQLLVCSDIYPCIKFRPKLTIDQITAIAKPEMLENYKRICQNPY